VSLIPLVLGLILAPVAEKAYFQSMLLSDNSLMIFLTRPISLALLVIALISIVVPLIKQNLKEQDE